MCDWAAVKGLNLDGLPTQVRVSIREIVITLRPAYIPVIPLLHGGEVPPKTI